MFIEDWLKNLNHIGLSFDSCILTLNSRNLFADIIASTAIPQVLPVKKNIVEKLMVDTSTVTVRTS